MPSKVNVAGIAPEIVEQAVDTQKEPSDHAKDAASFLDQAVFWGADDAQIQAVTEGNG